MNKLLICIAGFLSLAILSGCISAREEQNPQPKAEIPCEEWGNNLNTTNKGPRLTLRQVAQNFIDACTVGDYDSMPRLESGTMLQYCPILADATIKNITASPRIEDLWIVDVVCPVDSKQRHFCIKKRSESYNGKTEIFWEISFPVSFL